MPPNNAHISLRRRIAKQIGRPISDAAWSLAIKRRYVAEALNPAFAVSGERELSAFLRDVLRVEDAALSTRLRSARPRPRPRGTASLARLEAISRLAAELAAGDEEILRYRTQILRRDQPMSPELVEAYLDSPDARGSGSRPFQAGESMPLLKYHNRRISHDLHVWPNSPLDKLRILAEKLAQSYPWEPAQAAAFVLEGLIPLATPFMLRLPQTRHEGRPRRAKLIMEVDLWMPADDVLRAYREVQRKVLPGHNRPIAGRSIALVNFVMRHRPATWASLLARWNTEHPGQVYANYRSFRNAFERASRSLLHPTYKLYLGR